MARNYFPFYFSLHATAQTMKPKMRAAFYEAIINYGVTGEIPTLPDSISGYWPIVQPMLDAARKHYEAGEKGGRPSKQVQFGSDSSETNSYSKSETTGFPISETNNKKENKKEKEKQKETPVTAAAPRTDSDLAEIVQHFEQVIGIFPRSALDKLQRWRGIYSVEIIRAAIDEAAENNVRKWRYVDGVLKGWQDDGVRTLGDVEARREARKKPEQPQEKKWEMLT